MKEVSIFSSTQQLRALDSWRSSRNAAQSWTPAALLTFHRSRDGTDARQRRVQRSSMADSMRHNFVFSATEEYQFNWKTVYSRLNGWIKIDLKQEAWKRKKYF